MKKLRGCIVDRITEVRGSPSVPTNAKGKVRSRLLKAYTVSYEDRDLWLCGKVLSDANSPGNRDARIAKVLARFDGWISEHRCRLSYLEKTLLFRDKRFPEARDLQNLIKCRMTEITTVKETIEELERREQALVRRLRGVGQ